jgi:hypothetical protein
VAALCFDKTIPVSVTVSVTSSPTTARRNTILPPLAVNLIALLTRFPSTWMTRS